jgi:hypothetical protein
MSRTAWSRIPTTKPALPVDTEAPMEIGGLVRAFYAGASADQYWMDPRLLDSDLAPPRMLTANLRATIRFLASQPQATRHKNPVCRFARGQQLGPALEHGTQ